MLAFAESDVIVKSPLGEVTTVDRKLPPVILPVAVTNPAVLILPPITLAAAIIFAPESMLPVALTYPAVKILAPTTLPDADITPVPDIYATSVVPP